MTLREARRSRSRSRSRRRSRSTASAASSATAARASARRVSEDGQLVARQPRRDVGDHDVRGRAVHAARSPATSPSSARSARCCRRSTASRGGRGRSSTSRPSAASARSAATSTRPCARAKVKRILSRNHPEIDEGWICDKGRFALHAPARRGPRRRPMQRVRRRGLEAVSWERGDRRGRAAAARRARPRRHRALRLRDGRAGVRARRSCCAPGSTRTQAMLPEEVSGALDALPAAALRDPRRRRRRRARRRAGRRARAGRRPLGQGGAAERREDPRRPSTAVGEAERVVLIWSGPGGRGGATVARLAEKLGLAGREGCGAFYLPETPNGRGVADAWAAVLRRGGRGAGLDRRCSSSPATRRPQRPERPRARRAGRGDDRRSRCSRARGRLGRPRPAGHELPRARRHVRQPRGAAAAAAPHGDAARAPTSSSGSSQLAARFGVDVAPYAAGVFARGLASASTAGSRSARSASARRCASTPRRREHVDAPVLPEPQRGAGQGEVSARLRTSRSSPAPPSSASRSSSSSGRSPSSSSRPTTRRRRGIADGRHRHASATNGSAITLPRPRQPAAAPGHRARRARARERARAASSSVAKAGGGADGMTEPWWIALIEARRHRQHPARPLRVPDADRAEGDGPDAAPLRPEPRRQVRPAAADRRPRQAHPQGGVLAVEPRSSCRTSSRRSSRRSPRSPPSRSSRSGRAGR